MKTKRVNCSWTVQLKIKITSDMKILCIDIFDHIVTLRHTDVDSFFIVHGRQDTDSILCCYFSGFCNMFMFIYVMITGQSLSRMTLVFFCVLQKKQSHAGLTSGWINDNFHFWVNFHFKTVSTTVYNENWLNNHKELWKLGYQNIQRLSWYKNRDIVLILDIAILLIIQHLLKFCL